MKRKRNLAPSPKRVVLVKSFQRAWRWSRLRFSTCFTNSDKLKTSTRIVITFMCQWEPRPRMAHLLAPPFSPPSFQALSIDRSLQTSPWQVRLPLWVRSLASAACVRSSRHARTIISREWSFRKAIARTSRNYPRNSKRASPSTMSPIFANCTQLLSRRETWPKTSTNWTST